MDVAFLDAHDRLPQPHPYPVISTGGAGSPASAFARWGAEALFAPQWRDPCIRLCSCRVCIECGSTRPPSFTHTNTPSSRPESRSSIARRSGETPVFAFAVALTLATNSLLLLGRPRLVTDGFSRGSPWHHTPPDEPGFSPWGMLSELPYQSHVDSHAHSCRKIAQPKPTCRY